MSHYRTDDEVRSYDTFKGLVTGLLAVAVFVSYSLGQSNAASTAGTSPGEETAVAAEGQEDAPESAGAVEIGAPELLSPAPGSEMEAGPETFSGMGAPGSGVAVTAGGEELGRTTVAENGTWEVAVELPAGVQAVELQALDDTGAVVAASEAIPIIVLEPPPADGAESDAAESAYEGAQDAAAEAEATAAADAQATADADEAAAAAEATAAAEGGEEAAATAEAETTPETESLDEEAPQAPAVSEPESGLAQFDPLTGALIFEGLADPGSRVAAVVDDTIAGETTAADDGTWRLGLDLAPGSYDVSFAHLDEEGSVAAASDAVAVESPDQLPQLALPDYSLPDDLLAQTIATDEQPVEEETTDSETGEDTAAEATPAAPAEGTDGEETAEGEGAETAAPTAETPQAVAIKLPAGPFEWSGTAAEGTDVAIIVDGEVAGVVSADENGEFTLSGDLSAGARSVQVGLVGEDGQLVAQSQAIAVSVADTAVPTLEVAGDASQGDAVTVSGTAEPGSTVEVSADGEVIAETTAADDGSWSVDIEPFDTDTAVRAAVVDEDGNLLLQSSTAVVAGRSAEEVAEAPDEAQDETAGEGDGEPAAGDEAEQPPEAPQDVEIDGEADTAIEAIESSVSFSILRQGLEDAGLTESLDDIDGAYTVFAPTDSAFEAIPPDLLLGWEVNPDVFIELMRFLVVEGEFLPDDLTDGLVLQTLGGTNVGVTHRGDLIQFSGVPVIDYAEAGSSVVYAMPQVVLPPLPAGVSPPVIDQSGVPVFTGPTLTVVGTAEPGLRILLTVDDEPLGNSRAVTVQPDGTWQVVGEVASSVRTILAYMIDDRGVLVAVSQPVELPVPE